MTKIATIVFALLAVLALVVGALPNQAGASSHREAPLIAYDPQADNTDVYAFVSPDRPDTVTLLANFVPLQEPAGGPNFFEFGEDVLYEIVVVNDVEAGQEISYQFRFRREIVNPDTFLYNTDRIDSLDDPDWNIRQFYSVTRVESRKDNGKGNGKGQTRTTVLGTSIPSPPNNIGPRSTPNYEALARAAVRDLPGGVKVFAGQRDEGFYVDLGSAFDLLGLRPFNPAHVYPLAPEAGIDGFGGFNIHTIALQVPITSLTRDGSRPSDAADARATLGVYSKASRQSVRVLRRDGSVQHNGPFVQVSRLAMPLTNEVLIPVGRKDFWNTQEPLDDRQFEPFHLAPEPTRLANKLYPVLDDANETNRTDIVAIFLTGVRGLNYTGERRADLQRLNVAIPPNPAPSRLGVLEGDLAGFPNGRRVTDDVVDIEVRALMEGYGPVASAVLQRPNRTPNNTLGDGVDRNDVPFLASFPYLGTPHQGYEHLHHLPTGSSRSGGLVAE